jgi:hypothetical protein
VLGERGVLAALGALGAFVAGLVALLVYVHPGSSHSPGPSISASSSPSGLAAQPSNSTPTDGSAFPTLTYPNNGQLVERSSGFVASGAVPSALWPDTIWILDHGKEYIVDTEATVRGGNWSAPDYPLGDSSNILPYDITVVAVLANRECASRLSALDQTGSGDHTPDLPAGCTQFGQVTVSVARP